ncbi:MAG: Rha family transcriptional regulator [Bacillota bacterium]|nr:Rha family transcriptional regulator [Bacillota bacterium]
MKKELIKDENEEVLTIDSREVAKMIKKDHSHLMRDIKNYIKVLNDNPKLDSGLTVRVVDYFIESHYQLEESSRKYSCYLVTKKGCEMIANKLIGKKGILFTASYIEKFHSMEKQLMVRAYNLPQTFSEALRMLADQVDENGKLKEENLIMKPKSDFYDRVTKSETTFSMNDTAKILNYKDMGRNKLFSYLRNKGILMTDNRPYQRFVDSGYFKEIESDFVQNGEIVVNHTTCVYQRGIDYIRKLLDKDGYEINKRGIKEKKENIIQLEDINN